MNHTESDNKNERTVYTSCMCNCGGNSQCVIKAHVVDGKVVAVEPDDRYNRNVGREDAGMTDQDLIKVKLQRRPCVMGLTFHRYIYHPDRILYPLKRAPGSKRGEGKYVRISWDEALDTIAGKLKECREKYGPYSIITPFSPNEKAERLFSIWGAGVEGWGWCSTDAARLMAHVISGEEGWAMARYASGSAADMLANSKMVVLWGNDATVGHQGPAHQFAYFIKLARERGKPVIIIDPRYSTAVKTLADQWIPIKPGTDTAMFMAIAHVLFERDLWNKEFVEKFVEPKGFGKWRDYVSGTIDGIPKTPEWAEVRCAVPAETIRALAMMIGTVKPAWLWCHFTVSRKSHGEQTIGAFAALQAMMGYWGTPGAGPVMDPGSRHEIPLGTLGPPGEYKVPKLYRSHYWAEAVLWLDKVRNGEMSEEEYRQKLGWRTRPEVLKEFNPKFLWWGKGTGPHASDTLSTTCNSSNNQVKAFEKMDFVVSMHSIMTPTVKYADIILPARDPMWEDKYLVHGTAYGCFESFNMCPQVVDPPGEVKSWIWVYCKIAERLGIAPQKYFKYYTSDENWDRDWERYQRDGYENIINFYEKRGQTLPIWEEFKQGKFINCDELEEVPFTGWDEQVKEDKPFRTKSGKIELFSEYIADEKNRGKGDHLDSRGRVIDNLPADWLDMTPHPTYMNTRRGMDDPLVKKYPIMLLTSHSRYRVHYLFWEHKWLRSLYKHRVWMNVADAKVRGIRDGDKVVAYNDRGRVIMPAYVTPRLMPGLALIHSGGKNMLGEDGIDYGAAPSTLLGGDFESCHAPARATNLIQIEKA
jgi:anaerobic dimethyl sulfoxide reductase subunit A